MARSITVARLFYQLEANTKGLERELGSAEKSLGRTAAFIKANPVVALAGLGTAMVGVAVKAVAMASEFEKSLAEVSTLVDTTSVDMKKLGDGVLDLYRSMPVENINDLTQGLYNVISAGVPAGDAIDYLRIATEAAVGGVTDVNTAVNGLTTATNAFASQGLTAQEAADKFFTAVRLGKTTFAEISGSIGNVAGLANSLGVSLDDLLSNMTALTLGGLNTSTAFNSLRQILANVAKPTAELKREYPALAKEFDLTALKTKGLTGFMTELAGRLKGNDDAAVKMFGSVEALNAVLSLTADGGTRLNGIQEQMANSAGASSEAFDKMAETNKALNQILKNEFAAQMIALGEQLLPAVNYSLRVMIGLLSRFNGEITRMKADDGARTIDTISRAFDALKPAKQAEELGRLSQALANVAGVRGELGEGLDRFSIAAAAASQRVEKLASDDLQKLYKGFALAANSGRLTEDQMTRVTSALRAIGVELTSRGDAIIPAEALTPAQAAARDLANTLTTVREATVDLSNASKESLERYQAALLGVAGTEKEAAGDKQLLIDIENALIKKRQEGGEAAEDAAKKAKEAADKYAAAMGRIADILAASTVSLVDDTELAIERLKESFKGTGVAAEHLARALRPMQDQLRLIKLNERLELPEILKKSAQAWTPNDVTRLRDAEGALRGMLADVNQLVPGTQAWKQASEQHAEVSKALFSTTTATVAQVNAAIRPTEEWIRRAKEAGLVFDENGQIIASTTGRTIELSQKVKDIALGAIGVAEGFGIIDSTAASALKSIVGIADALPQAFSGDPNAIFSVLGGLTGVIGALFGGNSAEERARKELIRKNTEAIRELERTNGNLLRVNSPGFQLSGAREVLGRFLPALQAELNKGGVSAQQALGGLQQNLATRLLQSGLSLGNLENLAKDLGINIRTSSGNLSVAGLTQLLEALETGQFTKFADEIQEQFERIKTGIELGVIDPADELAEILKVLSRPELGKGVPAIARAFEGIDLGTAEGREQARGNLQSLFRDLERGTLSESDFGGLSGSEFRDILVRLFGFLQDDAAPGGSSTAEPPAEEPAGPAVQPSPAVAGGVSAGVDDSETLGSRLPATLDDLLGVNEEANRFLEQILASITAATAGGPLRPPALPRGFLTQTAPGAGASVTTVTFGDIVVHVAGSSASAQEIADATRQSVEETIDRLLSERLQRERAILGDGRLP